jgi:hypothetical protein
MESITRSLNISLFFFWNLMKIYFNLLICEGEERGEERRGEDETRRGERHFLILKNVKSNQRDIFELYWQYNINVH